MKHTKIKGAALVEYGLLIGLLAVVAATAITSVGVQVTSIFNQLNVKLGGGG